MISEIFILIFVYFLVNICLWYKNRIKIHNLFVENGIKGPKPSLIWGNMTQLRKYKTPNETIDEWIHEYGDCFGYFLGDEPILVINDLDMIQQIFITNNKNFCDRPNFRINAKPFIYSLLCLKGDHWRHVRRMITPTFSHHKVMGKEITDTIISCTETFLKYVESQGSDSPIIEIHDRLQAITLDIICKCALNMENNVQEMGDPLFIAVKQYMKNAESPVVLAASAFPFLRPIFTFINNYMTAGKMTDLIVRKMKTFINDINSSLEGVPKFTMIHSLLNCFAKKQISADELIGNSFVILLAGYDTTSNGLTYTLYLLAKHNDIQNTLREDILNYGERSPYLDMVWNETMRLYPPVVTFVTRNTNEDITINDIFIPKGTTIQAPVWHIHHDENIWPDPYRFDPQRFSPENKKMIHPAALLTFGLGPRTCLGMQFANHNAKIIISKILSKYRLEMCDKTIDPLTFNCPTVIINPSEPIYIRFVPINSN